MRSAGPLAAKPRLCALLTSFNRRDKTLACLDALRASFEVATLAPAAVLVDDASTDGTAQLVYERHPWVQVIRSEGDLYWCRGMHRAFGHALAQGYEHYLWLNDDTLLEPGALAALLACEAAAAQRHGRLIIVAGATRETAREVLSYGGVRRHSWLRPTRFVQIHPPSADAAPIDTFDGNIVLISDAAARRVGNLDPAYEHAMGDYDYGLRAARAGVVLLLAPGWQGRCDNNPATGTYLDPALPWPRRWSLMFSRKGLPWRSWWRFNRRHSGLMWPLAFAWPYVRMASTRVGLLPDRPRKPVHE